ncbi:MAG: DUF2179 domain-containing protein [Dehalobacterium sp.]
MQIFVMILLIQIIFVSLFTIRMIFTLKNRSYLASIISVVEIFVYVTGLNLVLKNLDNPINLAVYCLGYALGIIIGSKIEEKMALGYVLVQIITECEESYMADVLRQSGYGVTTWFAEGRDSNKMVMEVLTKRKHEPRLFKLMETLDKDALMISQEPRNFRGGFWSKKISDHNLTPAINRTALVMKKVS